MARKPCRRAITDAELLKLGRKMDKDRSKATTNIEGLALITYRTAQKWKKIERDGCCGERADADGYCWGIGKCPLHQQAEQAEKFVAGFLGWLSEMEEQNALVASVTGLHVSNEVPELENSNV